MQRAPLGAGARNRQIETFHPSFIQRAPSVKPFFLLGFGDVKGEATLADHSKRWRENARDLHRAVRVHPSVIHYVGLYLRRNPAPRNIPVINAERGAKFGQRARGNRTYSKVPKKHVRYSSVSDGATAGGSGPGENDVWAEELTMFHSLAASGLARSASAICSTNFDDV